MITIIVSIHQPPKKGVRVAIARTHTLTITRREQTIAHTLYALVLPVLRKLTRDVGGYLREMR
jgi:hypothetical protein